MILVLHNIVSATTAVVHVEEHDTDHYEEGQDHDSLKISQSAAADRCCRRNVQATKLLG